MPTIRTRAGKGSDLTPTEADTNFKRPVSQKTTTYSTVVGDNRNVIECNSASPFTVTLGAAATMAGAETGDYEVTIANIGAGAITVARSGSDTINGAATSKVIQQYESMVFKVNGSGDGYVVVSQSSDITTLGTVQAYRPVTADANKDVTGLRNVTATGTLTAAALSITGDLPVADGGTGASTADGARVNLGIYHGRVTATGTGTRLPSGWSSSRPGTGIYTITHNLSTTSLSVVISSHSNDTTSLSLEWAALSSSEIGVFVMRSTTGALYNGGFSFMVMKDS